MINDSGLISGATSSNIAGGKALQAASFSNQAGSHTMRIDVLPLAAQHDDHPRQLGNRATQHPSAVSSLGRPEIGRETFQPYDHKGLLVVASGWLAFYVIAMDRYATAFLRYSTPC
jgi:hypothetical protein